MLTPFIGSATNRRFLLSVVSPFAALFWAALSLPAAAQNVIYQVGPLTGGHALMGVVNGQAMDAGNAVAPTNPGTRLAGLGVVNGNIGYCQWSNYVLTTTPTYSQFCSGFDGSGNALLTYDNLGGGPPGYLAFRINGVLSKFPFATGGGTGNVVGTPVPSLNDVVLWNGGANGLNVRDDGSWGFDGTTVIQPQTIFSGQTTVPGTTTSLPTGTGGGNFTSATGPARLDLSLGNTGSPTLSVGASTLTMNSTAGPYGLQFNRLDQPAFDGQFPEGQFVWSGFDRQGTKVTWCVQSVTTETLLLVNAPTDSADMLISCQNNAQFLPALSAGGAGVGVSSLYAIGPTSTPSFAGDGWMNGYVPLEKQETQLLLQSNALQTAPWTASSATVTPGASGLTPFGTTDAETVANTAVGGSVAQSISLGGGDTVIYTGSIFFASTSAATTPAVALIFAGGNTYTCTLFIAAGAPTLSYTDPGSTNPQACGYQTTPLSAAGIFWYRLYVAGANSNNTSVTFRFYPNGGAGIVANAITYGAQVEQAKLLYPPTAYIPTVAHQVTRPNLANTPKLTPYLVADLPTCAGNTAGEMLSVSDAAASPVYNATAVGGGSLTIPVFCNGSNWTNH